MLDGQVSAHGMLRALASHLSLPYKAYPSLACTIRQWRPSVAFSSMARSPLSMVKRPAVSKDAVAIPPNEATMQLTALVEHILVQKEGCLSELIAEELNISAVGPCYNQSPPDPHGARCAPDRFNPSAYQHRGCLVAVRQGPSDWE